MSKLQALALSILIPGIPTGLFVLSGEIDRKYEELAHMSLPAIIRPYDTNRDGTIQYHELLRFLQDHPELKSSAPSP
jgi:hypothetical protein